MEYPELSLAKGSGTFSMRPRNSSFKAPAEQRGSVFAMKSMHVPAGKKISAVTPVNNDDGESWMAENNPYLIPI